MRSDWPHIPHELDLDPSDYFSNHSYYSTLFSYSRSNFEKFLKFVAQARPFENFGSSGSHSARFGRKNFLLPAGSHFAFYSYESNLFKLSKFISDN